MSRLILALAAALLLAAPAQAQAPGAVGSKAIKTAKDTAAKVQARYNEAQAEIDGKNDAPPPPPRDNGTNLTNTGPRSEAKIELNGKTPEQQKAIKQGYETHKQNLENELANARKAQAEAQARVDAHKPHHSEMTATFDDDGNPILNVEVPPHVAAAQKEAERQQQIIERLEQGIQDDNTRIETSNELMGGEAQPGVHGIAPGTSGTGATGTTSAPTTTIPPHCPMPTAPGGM